MKILTYPHPALRKIAIPVKKLTCDLRADITQMLKTMDKFNGVGLAANQVGLLYNLFVARFEDNYPCVFINPILIRQERPIIIHEEMCLSLPGISKILKRSEKITIKAQNINGIRQPYNLRGLSARIAQHEIDHLHGQLIIDHKELEFKPTLV